MVLENVISTKHYFQHKKNILQISVTKFKIQNIILHASTEFKIQTLFQPKEIAANFSYKIQNHRH